MSTFDPSKVKNEPDKVYEIDGESFHVEQLYSTTETVPDINDEFLITDKSFRLQIDPRTDSFDDREDILSAIFDQIVRRGNDDESTHVGVTLAHPDLNNSIAMPFISFSKFSGKMLLNEIGLKLQSSNTAFPLTDTQLHLQVTYAHAGPSGSGRAPKPVVTTLLEALQGEDQRKWSKSFTKIQGGNRCLIYSFILGRLYARYTNEANEEERKRLRKHFEHLQDKRHKTALDTEASIVMNEACITKLSNYRISDIRKLQKAFPQYRIFCFTTNGRALFAGEPIDSNMTIVLLLEYSTRGSGHFWHVKRLPALFKGYYYCIHCNVTAPCASAHYNCKMTCRRCGAKSETGIHLDCESDDVKGFCEDCNRPFRTESCYKRHLQKGPRGGKSWCDHFKNCRKCDQQINDAKTGRKHKCNAKYCHTCQADRKKEHVCTISPIAEAKESKEIRVVYDFETCIYEKYHRNKLYDFHKPVMLIALRSCVECRNEVPTSVADNLTCENCGNDRTGYNRLVIFECFEDDLDLNKVTEDFVSWAELHKETTFIAHNFKGFDGQFVLKELEKRAKGDISTVMNGRKIMLLKIGSNRFIDSLNFLMMKLAAFPKAFDLGEISKGYFPHLLNKPFLFNKPPGPLPAPEFYNPSMMSSAEYSTFMKWHTEQTALGTIFDFKNDMRKYCFSDVILLSQGVHKFATSFFEQTGVRVFEESSTIASAAMKVFRRKFVVDEKIAITVPLECGIAQSHFALCYLEWRALTDNVQIQHKKNGGEHKIPGTKYHADGFIAPTDEKRGKVIEVRGCYWHLHSCKYNDFSTVHGENYASIASRDLAKAIEIEKHYDLDIVWECDIRAEMKKNVKMDKFFKECDFEEPINFQDGFYGGRTEVFSLKVTKRDEEETLAYYDYMSLYPSRNKYMKYPVGAGEVVKVKDISVPITNSQDLHVEGFMRCQVVAPRKLHVPVLPYRAFGNLVFGLCRKCIESRRNGECDHDDEERSLRGTWCTMELDLALQKGYKIVKIFAAHHWPSWWQYDTKKDPQDPTRHAGFSGYIDCFLQLKTEASGYPSWVKTEEQKDEYILEFCVNEGILLYKEKIKVNPDARQVSKLLLNSLWGKCGERANMKKNKYVTDPTEFWKMLDDPSIEILKVFQLGPDMIRLEYRNSAEGLADKIAPYRSVPYAALTTCYGRLRLYEALDLIPEGDLAYADTDSLIFRYRGKNPVQSLVGDYLGQLTDELKPGWKMREFVAQGPKCYAYITENEEGKTACLVKCRGFKQTVEAVKQVNFETIARHVDELCEKDEDITVYEVPYNIIQNDGYRNLFNMKQIKQFGAMFNKRIIKDNYQTIPFGY